MLDDPGTIRRAADYDLPSRAMIGLDDVLARERIKRNPASIHAVPEQIDEVLRAQSGRHVVPDTILVGQPGELRMAAAVDPNQPLEHLGRECRRVVAIEILVRQRPIGGLQIPFAIRSPEHTPLQHADAAWNIHSPPPLPIIRSWRPFRGPAAPLRRPILILLFDYEYSATVDS